MSDDHSPSIPNPPVHDHNGSAITKFSVFIKSLSIKISNSILEYLDAKSVYHFISANKWNITIFFAFILFLIFTITLFPLKHHLILALHLWEFDVLLFSVFCGRLISGCIVGLGCSVLPTKYYLIHRLRDAIRTNLWIFLINIIWGLCINKSLLSIDVSEVVHFIYRAVPAVLLAFAIWQLKITVTESLRVTFYADRFRSRINRDAIDLYLLEALMDPESGKRKLKEASPMKIKMKMEDEMMALTLNTGRKPRDVVDKQLLKYIDGMKRFGFEEDDQSKTFEAAHKEFLRLAAGEGYIKREGMEDFLTKEEVNIAFPLMEDTDNVGKISVSSFSEWMVGSYQRRKSLIHAIINTEKIVSNIITLLSMFIALITFMISLAAAGVMTSNGLVLSFSQIFLMGFMFQNTAKTIFEGIIFVFVRWPFDVGDCCIIDGVKMIVEEINIMTTVFLQFDHEKIYYPNSELSKKPISNWSRSPCMGEKIELSIGISTPENSITELSDCIKKYLENKPEYWKPKHSLFVTGIQDNKMKIDLHVSPRTKYPNIQEMNNRMSKLLLELNAICQNLGIENYAFYPKETSPIKKDNDAITEANIPGPSVPHGHKG